MQETFPQDAVHISLKNKKNVKSETMQASNGKGKQRIVSFVVTKAGDPISYDRSR